VSEPLVNALNLYGLLPTHTLAIAMAALIIGGILLLHVDEGWKAFGFVALAVLLVPLSYAANLTTAEDWASYRSLGALASLCGIGLWFALLGVQRAAGGSAATAGMRLRYAAPLGAGLVISMSIVGLALVVEPLRAFPIATRGVDWPSVKWLATLAVLLAASSTVLVWRLRRAAHSSAAQPRFAAPLGAVAVLVVVAAGVLFAMRNVTSLFVEPMNDELSILQSSLHSGAADRANRVAVVTPGGFEGAAPLVRYDEFGVPALSHYWGPEPAVLMLLPPQRRSSVIVDALPPGSAHPANAFVVDMTPLRTLRHGWTVWSLRAR
jgi:hypothetical protein